MSRRSNPPHCEHREGQIQGKVVRTLTAGAVEFATLPGGDLQRTDRLTSADLGATIANGFGESAVLTSCQT